MAKSKQTIALMQKADAAGEWLYDHVERPVRHNRKIRTAAKVGALALAGGILYKIFKER